MERWSNVLHKELPWGIWQDPPKQIELEYDRVNNDRRPTPAPSPSQK
jgi:hypothetical protein